MKQASVLKFSKQAEAQGNCDGFVEAGHVIKNPEKWVTVGTHTPNVECG